VLVPPCWPRGRDRDRHAGTYAVYRLTDGISDGTGTGFRIGQIGTASLVSLAHGTNDARRRWASSPWR
jgi:phosphate/sulfate permease